MPTNINIRNRVNNLQLTTVVGGGLNSSYYTINSTTAPPRKVTNYLTFNRDVGITDGQTYTFTTTFNFAAVTFTILISLTGSATSSNYWIQLSAVNGANGGSATTGQISTVGTTNLDPTPLTLTAYNGASLGFSASVERELNGSFDDVTITISPV